MKALMDTGSMISLISSRLYNTMQVKNPLCDPHGLTAMSVTGRTLNLQARTSFEFTSISTRLEVRTYVAEMTGLDCLLGMNFLKKYHATLDFSKSPDRLFMSEGVFELTGQLTSSNLIGWVTVSKPQATLNSLITVDDSSDEENNSDQMDSLRVVESTRSSRPHYNKNECEDSLNFPPILKDDPRIQTMLSRHPKVANPANVPGCLNSKHMVTLELIDKNATIYEKTRPMDREKLRLLRETCDILKAEGVVRICESKHNNNHTFVKKKHSEEWRPCLDLRRFNQKVKRIRHPLPTADDLFNMLSGANYFTRIDLRKAFPSTEKKKILKFFLLSRYQLLKVDRLKSCVTPECHSEFIMQQKSFSALLKIFYEHLLASVQSSM